MLAFKVFAHDLSSPIQGGKPVWNGKLPHRLKTVTVDRSDEECGRGWNACKSAADALRIAGLWRNGRPSRLFTVDSGRSRVVERGNKLRASSWTIVEEITNVRPAIAELSKPFGAHAADMVGEQLAWRRSLARPLHDRTAVEDLLQTALNTRGLKWNLRFFSDARDAWAARDARDAWDARDARDAWDALTVYFAVRQGWLEKIGNPLYLTCGLREAYANGLELALPTGPDELGFAMAVRP